MPSKRALIRRLNSLSAGCAMPYNQGPQAEIDRRRFYFAEELLKIRAEDSSKDLSTSASEALAAAELIYPEPVVGEGVIAKTDNPLTLGSEPTTVELPLEGEIHG